MRMHHQQLAMKQLLGAIKEKQRAGAEDNQTPRDEDTKVLAFALLCFAVESVVTSNILRMRP